MHRLTQGKNLAYVYCSVENFFFFFGGEHQKLLKILHTADTIILWIKFYKLGAAKAKKGQKASLDTSASEVINLNENAVSLTTLFLFILIFILSMTKSGFEI